MRRQWVKRDCTFEQDEALDYQTIQRNILRPGNKFSFSIPTSRSFPKHIRRYYLFLIITFKLYNFINQTKKKKGFILAMLQTVLQRARTHCIYLKPQLIYFINFCITCTTRTFFWRTSNPVSKERPIKAYTPQIPPPLEFSNYRNQLPQDIQNKIMLSILI